MEADIAGRQLQASSLSTACKDVFLPCLQGHLKVPVPFVTQCHISLHFENSWSRAA